MTKRIVISLTGATGQVYGIRALQLLNESDYEVHLILSNAAKINLKQEAQHEVNEVTEYADVVHDVKNIGAKTASGSFRTEGMLITPCSMKTLSNIAHGDAGNLISRTADVMLKERRPLVVMPREKPFNLIHLKNMVKLTEAGGIVFPPFPSFYQQPWEIDEMITRTTARALSLLDVQIEIEEWAGIESADVS